MQQKLDTVVETLESAGFSTAARNLKRISDEQGLHQHKIAVVGEFKTGKSTLINRIFLSKPILFRDIEEATAIPTEVTWGSSAKLEVYNFKQRQLRESEDSIISEGLQDPLVIPNPDSEAIKQYTAGDSPEMKEELARTTAFVRVELPEEGLKGLILIDTPGVNSGSPAVLSTVVRILPQSDLIIFVKGPKQFSNPELEFLSSKAFEETGNRGIILVNEDPNYSNLDEDKRKQLKSTMQAQLRNIGRIHLPIEWTQLAMGESVEPAKGGQSPIQRSRSLDGRQQEAPSLLDKLRGRASAKIESPGTNKGQSVSDTDKTLYTIAGKLTAYLRANAPHGRRARIRTQIQREIESTLEICRMELANLDRDVSELAQTEEDFKEKESEFRARYDRVAEQFLNDLGSLQHRHVSRFGKGLNAMMDRYHEQLSSAQGLSDVVETAQRLEQRSRGDLEEVLYTVSKEAERELSALQDKYDKELRDRFAPYLQSNLEAERLYAGFAAKVPPAVIYAIDVFLSVKLGPFGIIGDLILRLIATKIPIIKKITPTEIAKGFMKKKILSNFREGSEILVDQVQQQSDTALEEAKAQIRNGWEEAWKQHVQAVTNSLNRAQKDRTSQRRQELASCIQSLNELSASLT